MATMYISMKLNTFLLQNEDDIRSATLSTWTAAAQFQLNNNYLMWFYLWSNWKPFKEVDGSFIMENLYLCEVMMAMVPFNHSDIGAMELEQFQHLTSKVANADDVSHNIFHLGKW
jgi:hypothetical protein